LPQHWGIFFDIATLSFLAPIDEELWKGMIVAFFFFRRGGPARCFLWGVLAGAGFNLLETFQNSVGVLNTSAIADQTLSQRWFLFACARGGTGAIHSLATGLSALGFYGLLRRDARYILGYPAGVMTHGTWNFLVYAVSGDAIFSRAWPDTTALDFAGSAGLMLLFLAAVVMLWTLSGTLRDGPPAPIYRMLGMLPAPSAPLPEAAAVAPLAIPAPLESG
jgi:RsiW-degrading membrane proteinase PrsW (M82 family)